MNPYGNYNSCSLMSSSNAAPAPTDRGFVSEDTGFFNRLLGDLDDVFAYQTPKIAKIRDRKLGLLRLSLMLTIFVYIVIFQILYKGEHLKRAKINGVFRLQLQQPTMNGCNPFHIDCFQNFSSLSELPYCSQSQQKYHAKKKLECKYYDAMDLFEQVEGGMIMPTRIETIRNARGCKPSQDNNWSCKGALYNILDESGNLKDVKEDPYISDVFVADVEKFTVLIDHSFRTSQGGVYADDFSLNGFWMKCPDGAMSGSECEKEPIHCAHDQCPGSPPPEGIASLATIMLQGLENGTKGRASKTNKQAQTLATDSHESTVSRSQVHEEAIAVKKGDVFSIGELLQMAHQSLDDFEKLEETVRARGMILVLRLTYTNVVPWMGLRILPWTPHQGTELAKWYGPRPSYQYMATVRPAYDFSVRKVYPDPEKPGHRETVEYQGIRIVVEQSGEIAVWSATQFLLIFTTSLGLLAVSNVLTDMLAFYVFEKRAEYLQEKYILSKDFHV